MKLSYITTSLTIFAGLFSSTSRAQTSNQKIQKIIETATVQQRVELHRDCLQKVADEQVCSVLHELDRQGLLEEAVADFTSICD